MMQRRRRGPSGKMRWEPCESIAIRKGDVFRVRAGTPICCAREDAAREVNATTGEGKVRIVTLPHFLRAGDYE